jgi:hypothetical protein
LIPAASPAKEIFVPRKRAYPSLLLPALAVFTLALYSMPFRAVGSDTPSSISPARFTITAISNDGTNLVLTADVPPNSQQLTLEIRPALDAAWQDEASSNVQADANEMIFIIPRPTNDVCFFRLDDTPPGSSEYEFSIHFHPVRLDPVKPTVGVAADLKISAQIDGSDCLKITSKEATWTHGYYSWPTDVSLNEIHWDLQRTNVLKNEGTNISMPSGVNFSTAKIVGRKGRDLATMRADKDAI